VAVKDWLYPEKITASRPRWNTRTTGATQAQIKRTRINSEFDRSNMYRYNYRAEVLPPKQPPHLNKSHRFKIDEMSEDEKMKTQRIMESDPIFNGQSKRMEEMPVHPKLADKTKWKQSTIPLANELRTNLNRIASQSQLNSKKKNKQLKNYVSVEKKEAIKRANLRKLKESGADMSKFIMTGKLEDEPLMPTYNRLAKEPSQKYRVYKHSGKWEMNESEGVMMWSDTGSTTKESPGDIVQVINPAKYNFASPTVSRGENLGYSVFDITKTQMKRSSQM